jgi:hypothetical protein
LAREFGDSRILGIRDRAKREIGEAKSELRSITNIMGKPKVDSSWPSERARQIVKGRKSRAIEKIRASGMRNLAAHLSVAIKQDWRNWYYEPGPGGPKFHTE